MKKKGFLVLLFALVCLLSVGCGKDDDKKSSKKSGERTLKCTTEEDGQKMVVTISQNKKSYELTSGNVTMTMDLSDYGEAAKGVDWESMFCNSADEEMPHKSCKAEVNDNILNIDLELDMSKYYEKLKEDGEVEELDENTLDEIKKAAEDDDATCSIS